MSRQSLLIWHPFITLIHHVASDHVAFSLFLLSILSYGPSLEGIVFWYIVPMRMLATAEGCVGRRNLTMIPDAVNIDLLEREALYM
jgi:hypothetical protein